MGELDGDEDMNEHQGREENRTDNRASTRRGTILVDRAAAGDKEKYDKDEKGGKLKKDQKEKRSAGHNEGECPINIAIFETQVEDTQ